MTVRRFSGIAVFAVVSLLMVSTQAQAQTGPTVADMLTRVTTSFVNLPNILSAAAYLLGLFFAVTGIFKFKEHVDSPMQHHLSEGVKRFLAGGMLLGLPFMTRAVQGSLFSTPGQVLNVSAGHSAPVGGGMDAMIVNFVSNIYAPMTLLLVAFTYIAAIVLLLVGIVRLTKTAQEGPRGPAGLGTIMTFLASGALFSSGDMMSSFSNSLFGTNNVVHKMDIATTVINAADGARVSSVIEALMSFIMIVGYIAFIRGWFVMKAFADGNNNTASLAQALTFLFGGALAINMGALVNALQGSLGISGVITFS